MAEDVVNKYYRNLEIQHALEIYKRKRRVTLVQLLEGETKWEERFQKAVYNAFSIYFSYLVRLLVI